MGIYRTPSMTIAAPICPAPKASVYTSTGRMMREVTSRCRVRLSCDIHRGVTSRRSWNSSEPSSAPRSCCRAEQGWGNALPVRPNMRVWAKPSAPRILAASTGPNFPEESTPRSSLVYLVAFVSGSVSRAHPGENELLRRAARFPPMAPFHYPPREAVRTTLSPRELNKMPIIWRKPVPLRNSHPRRRKALRQRTWPVPIAGRP